MTFRYRLKDVKMAGGRGGLRGGREEVPRRRLRHRRTPTAPARARRSRSSASRRGAVASAPDGEDPRPRRAAHRLRPLAGPAHAGRGLGARRPRHLRRALHLLRRPEAARGQPAREVRRHHLPARRRHGAGAGQRHPEDRHDPAALQEDRRDAQPRRAWTQSDDIRGGMGLEGLAELAKFVQEGGTLITEGSTVHDLPGVRPHQRRHRRAARAASSCAGQ